MAAVIQAALMEAFTVSPPVDRPELHEETVAAHARIVDCIAAGDAAGAAAAMRAVIQSGVDRVAREGRLPAAVPTAPGI
jgi:DNA-binding FadR family transcriptional regulator